MSVIYHSLPSTFHLTCLCLCHFHFAHLSHILWLYILFVNFGFVCGLRTLKYLITTKTLKNTLVDCWSWSELLDLGLGNIPCAKRTWPMPAFLDQVIVNWAFIWCKPWTLFKFISYFVLVLIVILILCRMLCFELIRECFIWYMRRQRRLLAMGITCLDMAIFNWCIDLHNVWIWLISP